MADKQRKWAKSKVNTEQVKQNSKDAQQFVVLTEKYKTLGSQIESKLGALFVILKKHFTNFDPTLTNQEELVKAGQKETIEKLLKTAITPLKIDYERLKNMKDSYYYQDYISTIDENTKYQMVLAVEDFKDPSKQFVINDGLIRSDANRVAKGLINELREFRDSISKSPPNELSFKIVQNTSLLKLLAKEETKEAIRGYLDKYRLKIDEKIKEYLNLAKATYSRLSDALDPTNINQLKAAQAVLANKTDINLLQEWGNRTEAKEFFLKTTEEFHDAYSAFLELDDRTGERNNTASGESISNILSGNKVFGKNEKTGDSSSDNGTKADSSGQFASAFNALGSFFSKLFSTKKAEVKEESTALANPKLDNDVKAEKAEASNITKDAKVVEDTNLSDSKELVVHNEEDFFAGPNSKVIRTLAIETYESKEQVHKEYQTKIQSVLEGEKIRCFTVAMLEIMKASSCFIRKPFESVESNNKLDCEVLDLKAKAGMSQCEFIFPFEAGSDQFISDLLNQSSKVEVNVYEDGQTGLRSHMDEYFDVLTVAFGKAMEADYKLLPAQAQAAMLTEYRKPIQQAGDNVLKIAAPDASDTADNANSLVSQAALVILEKVDL